MLRQHIHQCDAVLTHLVNLSTKTIFTYPKNLSVNSYWEKKNLTVKNILIITEPSMQIKNPFFKECIGKLLQKESQLPVHSFLVKLIVLCLISEACIHTHTHYNTPDEVHLSCKFRCWKTVKIILTQTEDHSPPQVKSALCLKCPLLIVKTVNFLPWPFKIWIQLINSCSSILLSSFTPKSKWYNVYSLKAVW